MAEKTKADALKHLDGEMAKAEKDSGKPNRNPWVWVNNVLNPAKVAVGNGDKDAIANAFLVKYKSEPIDPAKEPKKEAPKKEA